MEKILTRKEACQFLKVGSTKFNELRRNGLVHPIRFGTKTNYKLSNLMDVIDLLTSKNIA